MPASIHIVAHFRSKAGQEDALKNVLSTLVAPTRRELGCFQYDLLQSPTDPREFCFVERWESEKALSQHVAADYLAKGLAEAAELIEGPPQGHSYVLV